MRVVALLTGLFLSLPCAAHAAPEAYRLDPYHTNITWQVDHFGFSRPSGKFTKVSGTIYLDEAAPEKSSLTVTINLASVQSGVDALDEHLRGTEFFDIDLYPNAQFNGSYVHDIIGRDALVDGMLSLHGQTKPVTLKVHLNKLGDHPMNKARSAGFTASTKIKRSDFGITTALPGLGDEVTLLIEAEANRLERPDQQH